MNTFTFRECVHRAMPCTTKHFQLHLILLLLLSILTCVTNDLLLSFFLSLPSDCRYSLWHGRKLFATTMKTFVHEALIMPTQFFGKDDVDNRTSESINLKDSPSIPSSSSTTPTTSPSSITSSQSSDISDFDFGTMSSDDMFREELRYKSFEGKWPHTFIEARILAKTGFYYIGPDDQVKCYFCKVEIGRWEVGDDAVTEHVRWSPNCPLLKRRETANEPIEPLDELDQLLPPLSYDVCGPCGIDIRPGSYAESTFSTSSTSSTPPISISPAMVEQEMRTYKHAEHAEYAIESARFRSFDSWPKTLKQKPQQLSDAGFFYTGRGDSVKCFSCNGGLRDWEENDDPWEQHALWFSKCEYLNLVKGKEYIESVKAKVEKETKEDLSASSQESASSEGSTCVSVCSGAIASTSSQSPGEKDDSRLCKICYCAEYNTAFFPCGHVIACAKCASSVTKCPLCRKPFERVLRLFYS